MVEWIVNAAVRAHPAVEKAKKRTCERFSLPLEATDERLKEFLAGTGSLPAEYFEGDDRLMAKSQRVKDLRWARYLRNEAQTSVHMRDLCSIF